MLRQKSMYSKLISNEDRVIPRKIGAGLKGFYQKSIGADEIPVHQDWE